MLSTSNIRQLQNSTGRRFNFGYLLQHSFSLSSSSSGRTTSQKQQRKQNPRKASTTGQWMKRHVNDPYVQKAQKEGIVSRSYYKLEQMDRKLNLFSSLPKQEENKKMMVVDLGAAPGGWSLYVSRQIGGGSQKQQGGKLLTIDLLPLDPTSRREIERNFSSTPKDNDLMILQGDFTEEKHNIQQFIMHSTACMTSNNNDDGAQVVLSDMASNFTGDSSTDALRTMNLVEEALDFAVGSLSEGGTFIAKYFSCSDEIELRNTAKLHFSKVRTMKPPASRKESAERYLVAMNFRGRPPK